MKLLLFKGRQTSKEKTIHKTCLNSSILLCRKEKKTILTNFLRLLFLNTDIDFFKNLNSCLSVWHSVLTFTSYSFLKLSFLYSSASSFQLLLFQWKSRPVLTSSWTYYIHACVCLTGCLGSLTHMTSTIPKKLTTPNSMNLAVSSVLTCTATYSVVKYRALLACFNSCIIPAETMQCSDGRSNRTLEIQRKKW